MSSYSPAGVHVTDMARQATCGRAPSAARPPDLVGGAGDDLELGPLGVGRQLVALRDRREAALGADGELADIGMAGGALDLAQQRLARLDPGVLARHQAEHRDRAAARQVAQGAVVAGALGVVP